jgi:hypothetical protein
MTKHAMTSADRAMVIEALKKNRNAAAVAKQFGFGQTTILALCKKEGIRLQHLLTKEERTEVVELLKANSNALATAKQLGVNHKTVLAIAKEERIDIKAMRQATKGFKTMPFTQKARRAGGKPVLQCAVYLLDGPRLSPSLNTSDTKVEGPQRMRLLLSHAIAERLLPRGQEHPAWGLYGGPIPQAIKRLLMRLAALPWGEYELERSAAAQLLGFHASTIDWLTNQVKAREADPERRARASTLARSRARTDMEKRTPISRSWQFGAVGGMLAVHSDGRHIYAQTTMAGLILRWPLAAQNRVEAEALVKPAVDARTRVREAARDWRECPINSPEAKAALTAVLREQRGFRDALLAVGAKHSRNWAKAVEVLSEPPIDESGGPDECTRWFVDLLLKNTERPPPERPVTKLLEEADSEFGVGVRGARRCYELAQEKTGNRNWSTRRRPPKSAS